MNASTNVLKRKALWSDLNKLQHDFHGPWFFLGDFNVVLGAHEVRGCRLSSNSSCSDFQSWTLVGKQNTILKRGLIDLYVMMSPCLSGILYLVVL